MKIQQIRNATLRITYAGKLFLTDPCLAAKNQMPSFAGKSPNPLVDLPCPAQEIISEIEMVCISHLHSDHFDTTAQNLLPRDIPVICQSGDELEIEGKGFSNIIPVVDTVSWHGIRITRTEGRHGSGNVLKEMGNASGFVFQALDEPTVYWTGDTIWCEAVAGVIDKTQPDIIITHSCGAVWGDNVLILMDAEQTVEVCRAAPVAVVVATHMEAFDHATVSRSDLKTFSKKKGIKPHQLFIPADGEILSF